MSKIRWVESLLSRVMWPRYLKKHFAHIAFFETVRGITSSPGQDIPQNLLDKLRQIAVLSSPDAMKRFHTSAAGLTKEQILTLRTEFGVNEINHERDVKWWVHLWDCYKNPFNLLLTVLALISYVTEDFKAATVIGSMILLSTMIRFWQESESNHAAEKLKAMVTNKATVIRQYSSPKSDDLQKTSTNKAEIAKHDVPIIDLVPGDIIVLSAGDMIPADARVILAKDLFVGQSAMTGESMPVEKYPDLHGPRTSPFELDNILFMGTNVVSGSAMAMIISTGSQTYFGILANKITTTDRAATAFQAGVNHVSWLLIRFMFAMVPIVLLLNGFTKGDWLQAALFGLSVAVGLTPEMLPMIATSTLAKGAVILSRKKVIVKKLDAIQNFGAMDILCTDKTGTLTQDKILLAKHTDTWGADSDAVLEYAYLNSYYQTGLKNLLDVAVLEHAKMESRGDFTSGFRKIDEMPFDFSRRRMSVVVEKNDGHHIIICKGAVEEITAICTKVMHDGNIEQLTPELLTRLHQVTDALNRDGLRVVAVAIKEGQPPQKIYSVSDESELILAGYIAFLDPPKDSTAPALKALSGHGVKVKILTGDNYLVTAKICQEVDLKIDGVLLGPEIDAMEDSEFSERVEKANIFAKLTPMHKDRIVRALKRNGHVVGFMGDGINDAPALRGADIGISVDSAVDIAKEAADIILLEKSLMVLEQGVVEGRKTFVNMLKYMKMTASSNFGNVLSVLVASAFIPFLPMLPMHLLLQNLLYDFSQIAIPFDDVDSELVALPQRWQPDSIIRFMLFFGPVSTIFDILTFAMMWFVFGAKTADQQSLFQSGWFIVGLLTQTTIVHLIRTPKIPFIQSRASWQLTMATVIIMVGGVFIPMGPFAHYFKLSPLPGLYFVMSFGILIGYVLLTQLMKSFYIKRYGWQ